MAKLITYDIISAKLSVFRCRSSCCRLRSCLASFSRNSLSANSMRRLAMSFLARASSFFLFAALAALGQAIFAQARFRSPPAPEIYCQSLSGISLSPCFCLPACFNISTIVLNRQGYLKQNRLTLIPNRPQTEIFPI